MGWLRKDRTPRVEPSPQVQPSPQAETHPAAPAVLELETEAAPPGPDPAPDAAPAPQTTEHGQYGPRVRISAFDVAPDELTWQLPVRGELYRVMPGPDRPDYSLMLLEKPLYFYPPAGFDLGRVAPDQLVPDRQGRRMVQVHALVLCARFIGQQLHPGMVDLPVNIAYVIDQSLARGSTLDLAKIEYAAIGFLTEGVAQTAVAQSPTAESPERSEAQEAALTEPESGEVITEVGQEVARLLQQGIAEKRGTPVERLSATITIDAARRISGLTGNADGAAPEPTPETFERIDATLARLAVLPPVSALTVHVAGSDITVDPVLRVP